MDPLTEASRTELLEALARRYGELLRPGEHFELTTHETARGVRGRLVLTGGTADERVELEARVDAAQGGLRGDAALAVVLDSLDRVMGEYLEPGRTERLSAAFQACDIDGQTVFVRGRVRFPKLEAQANALLGETPHDDWDE